MTGLEPTWCVLLDILIFIPTTTKVARKRQQVAYQGGFGFCPVLWDTQRRTVFCFWLALHVALQLLDGMHLGSGVLCSLLSIITTGDFESPYMCSNDNDA